MYKQHIPIKNVNKGFVIGHNNSILDTIQSSFNIEYEVIDKDGVQFSATNELDLRKATDLIEKIIILSKNKKKHFSREEVSQ